jgi:hypothetical protein
MERYNGVIKTAFPSVVALHPILVLSTKVYYTILSINKLYQKIKIQYTQPQLNNQLLQL